MSSRERDSVVEELLETGGLIKETYQLERRLGKGSMGEVWLAKNLFWGKEVALKFLLPGSYRGASSRKKILKEANVLANLTHDHIVRLWTVDEVEGIPMIVMEYLSGEDLGRFLKRRLREEKRGLLAAEVIFILKQLALAIDYAHAEKHVVHRDLKPANIMFDAPFDGEVDRCRAHVKVTDFGIAIHGDARVSNPFIGTLYYKSPELLLGFEMDRERCREADIYALGASLYELVTGHPPFLADTMEELRWKVTFEQPAAPRSGDGRLDEVILEALRKDPSSRPGSAGEMVERLSGDLCTPSSGRALLDDAQSAPETVVAPPRVFVVRHKQIERDRNDLLYVGVIWPAAGKAEVAVRVEPQHDGGLSVYTMERRVKLTDGVALAGIGFRVHEPGRHPLDLSLRLHGSGGESLSAWQSQEGVVVVDVPGSGVGQIQAHGKVPDESDAAWGRLVAMLAPRCEMDLPETEIVELEVERPPSAWGILSSDRPRLNTEHLRLDVMSAGKVRSRIRLLFRSSLQFGRVPLVESRTPASFRRKNDLALCWLPFADDENDPYYRANLSISRVAGRVGCDLMGTKVMAASSTLRHSRDELLPAGGLALRSGVPTHLRLGAVDQPLHVELTAFKCREEDRRMTQLLEPDPLRSSLECVTSLGRTYHHAVHIRRKENARALSYALVPSWIRIGGGEDDMIKIEGLPRGFLTLARGETGIHFLRSDQDPFWKPAAQGEELTASGLVLRLVASDCFETSIEPHIHLGLPGESRRGGV